MSNVVYSESEQVKLQELTTATNQFESYKQLILRAKHQGQDAQIVVQAVTFFDEMIRQTLAQINGLKSTASQRALKDNNVQDIKQPAKKKGAK